MIKRRKQDQPLTANFVSKAASKVAGFFNGLADDAQALVASVRLAPAYAA